MFDDLVALKLMDKDVDTNLLRPEDISKLKHCEYVKSNNVGAAFCINDRFEEIRKEHYSELKDTWISAVSQHPKAYLQYRLNAFISLLRTPFQKPYYPSEFSVRMAPYTFDAGLQPHTAFAEHIIGYVDRTIKILPIFFKPYFWLLLSIALAIALRLNTNTKTTSLFLLPLSGLTYILGYYPTTPAPDFRYVYFTCLVCTISASIYVNNLRKTKNGNDF
ncbi:hypothetical protein ACMHYO_01855 [Allopusillimonas ginsengisoli]|uniref:hypothetical protein n=1 Tax=Allopusillimonas ginsengisoli TaxID=453575 RepID=UPI0039C18FB7